MDNFTDNLIDEYAHSAFYKQLKTLHDSFILQTIEQDGNTYIPHALEAEFFDLLATRRSEMLSEECFELTKAINTLVYNVLINVIAGGKSGLDVGQSTYNASVTEYGLHTNYGWAYYGGGELDHEYHHTGQGTKGADFKLNEAFDIEIYNKAKQKAMILTIPAGTEIDAKDYMTTSTMDVELGKNINGSLGHFGNSLFIHIISSDSYYLTKNIAGAQLYPVLNFSTRTERKQVKLGVDEAGILTVSYY